ncbi:uncharacterized protein SAPINGB_P003882 [Magnusiomyces paraingens]|uniref:Uncharacterized protein n=1 Tax=Magnusiomyces paraingens TaxID=2606893 RepID=A0A5E8BSQ2_9ASCO|nr:uncharacterized protein SAPINGB_P003882 [Saprochaete ingens]VVT54051.1 unnamed protein product [Saprochaete ingens]
MSCEKAQLDALIRAILPDKNSTAEMPYIAINLTHDRFLEWYTKTLEYFAQTGTNSHGAGCFNEILESQLNDTDSCTTLHDPDPYDTATGITITGKLDYSSSTLELGTVVPAARRELDLRMYDVFKRYVEMSVAGDSSIAAVVRLHRPSSGALRCRSLLAWVERHSAAPLTNSPYGGHLGGFDTGRRLGSVSSLDSFSSCSLGGVHSRRSGGGDGGRNEVRGKDSDERTAALTVTVMGGSTGRNGRNIWHRVAGRVQEWSRAAVSKVSGNMAGAASLMTKLLFSIIVGFVTLIMVVFTVKLEQLLWTSIQALPTNQKGKVFVFSLSLFIQLAPVAVALFLGIIRGTVHSFSEGDGPVFVAAVLMVCLFVIPLLQLAIFYLYGKIFEVPKKFFMS